VIAINESAVVASIEINQINRKKEVSNKKQSMPSKADEPVPIKNDAAVNRDLLVLPGSLIISKELADRIREQVEMVLVALIPDVSYTVKKMCGEDFWSQLSRGQQIAAGQFVAYMVVREILPLIFAEPTPENSKQYKLK
jgi:hypothetical protein